ncbi:Glucose/arabinose dehydrogenase, beta-propeller fold [Georgenia satyanarayanai]|uniref:Glucose/arabinose dehydrogenase, beta-propeller fold n=1 Tax=Georgenia satyanarayanai TaxID=860221 RepID=A0A2Y9AKP4_9MICO|nr:PQQ-dependent sugar dehydrogenase [Georgenia satyanarayanai]PYF98897.1 glucose/arabinose dehydrogenase [Georgenia satyanarayanai]SSA44745.1 Glucose/arabinose dehydrogenase, beta-propeller fold [Georgenia satyanarayanai]
MTRTARTTTAGLLAVVVLTACGGGEEAKEQASVPSPTTTAPAPEPTTTTTEPVPQEPEVLATGLDVPWGVAFLPDGTALVTERDTARVLELVPGEEPRELATVPGVAAENETGLLGIAVSPDFADNGRVFVYLTTGSDNRVLRMVHDGERLVPDAVVLEGIPRETYHSGGRIHFGPDGYLYVATGDAAVPSTSQDPDSLGGKILRVDEDGAPAPGNPDAGSPVWSLGHRNVQGLGWDAEGRMFASEFGQDTWDELNLVEAGANYGWPEVEGTAETADYADPLVTWRPADASPSGIAVTDDAVYVAALRGQSLWRVALAPDGGTGEPQRLLEGEYGRLRTVTVAPDGRLWLVTSNTFRGEPGAQDDRVVAVAEEWLASRG